MSVLTNHFLSIWLCFYTCMLWYVIIWLALLWSHYFLPTCVLHIQWEFFSDLAVVTGSVKSKLRHLLQYFFWHICNSSKTCSQVRYLSSHQCRHLYDPRLFCPKYTQLWLHYPTHNHISRPPMNCDPMLDLIFLLVTLVNLTIMHP